MQLFTSLFVILCCVNMLSAIDFDHQSTLQANEVKHIVPERMLSPELAP